MCVLQIVQHQHQMNLVSTVSTFGWIPFIWYWRQTPAFLSALSRTFQIPDEPCIDSVNIRMDSFHLVSTFGWIPFLTLSIQGSSGIWNVLLKAERKAGVCLQYQMKGIHPNVDTRWKESIRMLTLSIQGSSGIWNVLLKAERKAGVCLQYRMKGIHPNVDTRWKESIRMIWYWRQTPAFLSALSITFQIPDEPCIDSVNIRMDSFHLVSTFGWIPFIRYWRQTPAFLSALSRTFQIPDEPCIDSVNIRMDSFLDTRWKESIRMLTLSIQGSSGIWNVLLKAERKAGVCLQYRMKGIHPNVDTRWKESIRMSTPDERNPSEWSGIFYSNHLISTVLTKSIQCIVCFDLCIYSVDKHSIQCIVCFDLCIHSVDKQDTILNTQ